MTHVHYGTVDVDGYDVFHREAGDRSKPTLLLLHGFPTSSHMFRELIPLLADSFHLVAPDLRALGCRRCHRGRTSRTTSTLSQP